MCVKITRVFAILMCTTSQEERLTPLRAVPRSRTSRRSNGKLPGPQVTVGRLESVVNVKLLGICVSVCVPVCLCVCLFASVCMSVSLGLYVCLCLSQLQESENHKYVCSAHQTPISHTRGTGGVTGESSPFFHLAHTHTHTPSLISQNQRNE